MKINYLAKFFLLGIACSLTSGLYAGGCSSDKDDSVRKRDPVMRKSERDQRVRRSSEQKMSGEWGARNPTSLGCPPNEGFILALDYLIMRAKNENLAYAYLGGLPLTNGSTWIVSREGTMVRPKRTWRPGFKIGLGWHTPFDDWDSNVSWMYYYNKSVTNDEASYGPGALTGNNTFKGFFPYWGVPTDIAFDVLNDAYYLKLHGMWNMVYNMLDWDLGRSIYLTKAFALRPLVGLRTGWIHQHFSVQYENSWTATGADKPLDLLVRENNKFWGFGLRAGFDSEWEMGAGFSFLGKFGASLLSGRTNTRRIQEASVVGTGAEPIYERTNNDHDRVQQIVPNLELSLGLGWGTCLSNDTMYLGFDVSWQSAFWWGQFSFIRPEPQSSAGANKVLRSPMNYPTPDKALSMEGVAIRGRFDF